MCRIAGTGIQGVRYVELGGAGGESFGEGRHGELAAAYLFSPEHLVLQCFNLLTAVLDLSSYHWILPCTLSVGVLHLVNMMIYLS